METKAWFDNTAISNASESSINIEGVNTIQCMGQHTHGRNLGNETSHDLHEVFVRDNMIMQNEPQLATIDIFNSNSLSVLCIVLLHKQQQNEEAVNRI